MCLGLFSEGIILETKNLVKMNDQELMQLLVAENLGAWSELVTRYGKLVYTIAYQILNNSNDTEDAVQNTFIRLKIYSSKFDHSLPLKPWLCQIASGEAIRIYNKKKNINKKESSRMEPENYSVPSTKKDVSEEIAQKEIELMVKKAIELLPELSRVAITLYYVGGMSQTEIAKELGLSQFSISEKIKIGLEKIKMHLKKAGVLTSIEISPMLVRESLSIGSFPIEFSRKLTNSLPTKTQIASLESTKAGFWFAKTKFLVIALSSLAMIIGGVFFYINLQSTVAPVQQVFSKNEKKITMLGKDIEAVDFHTPIQENKFQPMIFNDFNPIRTRFVEIKKSLDMQDVMEGNTQIIVGKSNWKMGKDKKNNQMAYRETTSGVDELDGFYFNQSFKQPYLFRGKIKINSNRNKVTFLLSTPMKTEGYHEISPNDPDLLVYSRLTCQICKLQGENGNLLEFKIYVWMFDSQLIAATFIKYDGAPESMITRSIEVFNEEFKLGIMSNGRVEFYEAEFCPLPVDWVCQMVPEIQQRINEIPEKYYKKKTPQKMR